MKRSQRPSLVRIPVLAVLLLMPALSAFSQDSLTFRPDVEHVFVEAMKSFSASQFDTAAVLFIRCIKDFPYNHRTTGAFVMAGKAYYRLGNYRESVRTLKNFIDLHPESGYIADAYYSLGLDYYRMLRYEDAAGSLVQAYALTKDEIVRTRSALMLDDMAANNLTLAEMQLLVGNKTPDAIRTLLTVNLAERMYRNGDVTSARELLEPVAALPPSTLYVDRAVTLLQRIQQAGAVKLGVLLPLMLKAPAGPQRSLGLELLEGIKLAADDYNQVHLPKVDLDVRDTERDPSVAARQVTEVCGDDSIVAILGPIFSNEAFAAAGIANAKGVPLLTPTATANGIASIGPYVFQLNPDFDIRGRAMARYAFQRGARRFAVLSPVSQISRAMAESFVDEVNKLGGEILDQEWYESGATDLRMQLSTMRQRALDKTEPYVVNFAARLTNDHLKKILMTGIPGSVVDSLVEVGGTYPVENLWGLDGKMIADSLHIPTERAPIKYDSLAMPVKNVDAIFLPITSSDEIGIVTSQLRYFNFQTQLLGSGEWNDPSDLDQNRQYADGVVYGYDTYIDETDQAYRQFAVRYQKLYNRKPTANALIGFDSMNLLLDTMLKGASRRNDIAAGLLKTKQFKGLHTKFTLGESRVNTVMTLLQFRNRTIRRIGDLDLSEPLPVPPDQP